MAFAGAEPVTVKITEDRKITSQHFIMFRL
jgi:hypothetical protein